MNTFKDGLGREWPIEINVSSIKRVKDLTEVNLYQVVEAGDLLDRLRLDIELLTNVLFALVKPIAETRQITDELFGQGMSGEAIAEGVQALLAGLVDFFPEPRKRVLAGVLARIQQLEMEAVSQSLLRVESNQFDRLIAAKFQESDMQLEAEILRISGQPPPSNA